MIKGFLLRYVFLMVTGTTLGIIFLIITGGSPEDMVPFLLGVTTLGIPLAAVFTWKDRN